MEKLIKRSQVAKILGITPGTLYRWSTKNKYLKVILIGGLSMYSEKEVIEFSKKGNLKEGEK